MDFRIDLKFSYKFIIYMALKNHIYLKNFEICKNIFVIDIIHFKNKFSIKNHY